MPGALTPSASPNPRSGIPVFSFSFASTKVLLPDSPAAEPEARIDRPSRVTAAYSEFASPEPISNSVMSVGELTLVATVVTAIWRHPFLTLSAALAILVALMLIVRLIWRTLRQVFAGRWVPYRGFRQDARTSDRLARRQEDE